MKKIIIFALALIACCNVYGQLTFTLDHDPAPFLGKWVAHKDGMSYELTMIRDTIDYHEVLPERNVIGEKINCYIIYKRGNNIIRNIEPDGIWSMLLGDITDPYTIDFQFEDMVRKISGYVKFTIIEGAPNYATWKLRRPDMYFRQEGGADDFDIPRELLFHKHVEQDSDFEGIDVVPTPPGGTVVMP